MWYYLLFLIFVCDLILVLYSSIANLRLAGLSKLKVMSLEANDIIIVDGLSGLPNLQQLILSDNKIKRIGL